PGGGQPQGPPARARGERPARDRGDVRDHLGLHVGEDRVALPARHPDRTRDEGRPRRARHLPARPPHALRRPAPDRHRPGADPPRRSAGGRAAPGERRMIVSPGAFVRVGILVLLAVILQLSALSQIEILGGHLDLVVLVVAAVAYYAGSVPGSATGFAAGFLLDLLSGATMGASSLVLTAVGY